MKGKLPFILCLTLAGLPAGLVRSVRADDRPALSLQEVLQRHMQALGGAKALAVPTTERATEDEETRGLRGTLIIISKGPSQVYFEDTLGVDHTASGYDGKTAWERDSNGDVRHFTEEELKDLHNTQYLGSYSYLFPDRLPGKVALRPQTERHTGDYVLDIEPDGGRPCSLFIDPKTFLVAREMDQDSLTTYSDYRPVNGVMTAATEHSTYGSNSYEETTHLTSDEINIEVPDTLFALPALQKNYEWLTPKATSATIPFDASDHSINLFVGVNGEPAYVVLDSGDSGMSLARQASDYLKLKRVGAIRGRGYGGSATMYPVKVDTFEIADGVVFQNLTGRAIDLPDHFGFGAATPDVGSMGYPILSHFVVQIDYSAQHLTLYDPNTWQPVASDGEALPLEIYDDVPNITAQFDDLPPARFLLDTGDAFSAVKLYTPFIASHKLSDVYPKGMDVWGTGVGGSMKERRVRAHSLRVGGVTLHDVPTDLALDSKGDSARRFAGALGNDFLSHFTVTLDYPHNRVFFAPNKETQKPFDTRSFGLYLVSLPDELIKDRSRIVVHGVDFKSPAYRAGLQPGDTITAVDGQPALSLGLGEVRRLLSPDGGKDSHELSIIGPQGGAGKVKVTMYDPLAQAESQR